MANLNALIYYKILISVNMTKKKINEKSENSTIDKNTSFTCDQCGETFNSQQELREHTYYH